VAPTLLAAVSSFDPKKSCTLPDRVLRCDGSRITSLHHQGNGMAYSLSNKRTVYHDTCILHGPCGLLDWSC
jgi:hypothetical protein